MADEKTPDSTADSSTAVIEQQPVVEDELTVPEGVKDEKSRARIQKVIDDAKTAREQLAKWSEFGTPEDVQNFVRYAQQVEADKNALEARINALESKREPGEAKSDEQKAAEAEQKKIDKALREALPFLNEWEEELKSQKAEKAYNKQMLEMQADASVRDLLKEEGLPVTPESHQKWAKRLVAIIGDEPLLKWHFRRGNTDYAFKKAMDIYAKEGMEVAERKRGADQQRGKEKLVGLPRAHGGGGGPGTTKTPEPPKTTAEGVSRALARFREKRG